MADPLNKGEINPSQIDSLAFSFFQIRKFIGNFQENIQEIIREFGTPQRSKEEGVKAWRVGLKKIDKRSNLDIDVPLFVFEVDRDPDCLYCSYMPNNYIESMKLVRNTRSKGQRSINGGVDQDSRCDVVFSKVVG